MVFKTTAIDHSAIPPHDSFEKPALECSVTSHDITGSGDSPVIVPTDAAHRRIPKFTTEASSV